MQGDIEEESEEPMSFFQKRQHDFEKQCRLLGIEVDSPEAEELRKTASRDANNNAFTNAAYSNTVREVRIHIDNFSNQLNKEKNV